jgi:hypothetical protein
MPREASDPGGARASSACRLAMQKEPRCRFRIGPASEVEDTLAGPRLARVLFA